ncbi:hypothetical protein FP744_10006647 [Trichoderma asperellum]
MSTVQQNEGGNMACTETIIETEDAIRIESHLDIESLIQQEDIEDDNASTDSSEVSDVATSILLSAAEEEAPPLGLSRGWGNSSYDDYDVITVHGLRDNHSTAWKSLDGEDWLRVDLFEDIPIRQLDFFYATDESARVFQEEGIKTEARYLLQEYYLKRRELPDIEANRPIALIECMQATTVEEYGDVETWGHMKEFRRKVIACSTTIVYLGCPHRVESTDILEDELHELLSFPGHIIKQGILRKIKTVARQVSNINFQFSETNLFSHMTSINIFCLHTRSEIELDLKMDDKNATNPHQIAEGCQDDLNARDDSGQKSDEGLPPALSESPSFIAETGLPFCRYSIILDNTFGSEDSYRLKEHGPDHLELVRGKQADRRWVLFFSGRFAEKRYPLKINTDAIHDQIALLSLIPPRKMPRTHMGGALTEHHIRKLQFTSWLANQEAYKNCLDSRGPHILYIDCYAEEASRAAMLSQYVRTMYDHHVDDMSQHPYSYRLPFYFEFNQFDTRYNSIKAMIITFLCEMVSRHWHTSPTIRLVLRNFHYYRCWSLKDLFKLFTEIRKCPFVNSYTLFLCCWDSCIEDERTWFLTRVLEQHSRSELDYTIVITTRGPDKFLKSSIDNSQVLSLETCPVPLHGFVEDEGDNVSGLMLLLEDILRKRPALQGLKSVMVQLIDECSQKPHLGYIILNWLGHFGRGSPISDIARTLERLRPVTPDSILAVIIGNLRPEKRKLAQTIYRWVRYGVEPLTVGALGHAIAASTTSDDISLLDIDHEYLLENLERIFCGIIKIEGHDIKFSYDSFYVSNLIEFEGDVHEQVFSAHGELARACLRYLLCEEVQKQYSKFSVENYGGDVDKCLLLPPRDDLLAYAVRLWATHYRLSGHHRPLELALTFFKAKGARNKWAEAHYLLSNPFTRCQRSFISALPLTAALGLEDIISKQIEEQQYSQYFEQDCWLAIAEAARNGHIHIVRKLLGHVQAEELGLQDAIFWATHSGNEKVMTELLGKVALLGKFSFPGSVLLRAAAAGLHDLVSSIIQTDYDLSETNLDIRNETALHTAVYWGHEKIVELLLDSNMDPTTEDGEGRTAFRLAVMMGDTKIIQLFLNKRKMTHDEEQLGPLILNTAISVGEYAALKCLLLAGVDCNVGAFDANDELRYPIIHAAACGKIRCLHTLLENGADPCTKSKEGSPLYLLCNEIQAIDGYRALLKNGADPNECYSDREMLIKRALKTNDKRLIEVFCEYGAQFNKPDTNGITPITVAVSLCSTEIVEYILDKGADANYTPEGATAPILYAVTPECDIKIAELLLSRGANVNCANKPEEYTPLHLAYDMPDFATLFLKHGADINATSRYGTVLMLVAKWGRVDTMKILLSHKSPPADLNATIIKEENGEDYPKTALDLALQYKQYECANLLLEAGAQLDAKFEDARLVVQSCEDNNTGEAIKIIRYYLQHGIQADHMDEHKNTMLHGIEKLTTTPLIQLLIGYGCPFDTANNDGLTPLAMAVKFDNIAAAKYLISIGARTNVSGPSFGSLLHLALKNKSRDVSRIIEMMKILIDAKTDPHTLSQGPECESLLHMVIPEFQGRALHKLARFLVDDVGMDVNGRSGSDEYPIIIACEYSEWNLVDYLHRRGADVNLADGQGRRATHYAAALAENPRPIRVLAKAGADMQAADKFGRTPLHFIATSRLGCITWTKAFTKNLDINIKDIDGWTPLMWACKAGEEGRDIVRELISGYGADIWARSTDGEWSPFKLACLNSMDTDILEMLQPPEGEQQRICEDGTIQHWDVAPHYHPWKIGDGRRFCQSCFMSTGWPRFRCTVCKVPYKLCFKCVSHQDKMHNAEHEFTEYFETEHADGDEMPDADNESDSRDRHDSGEGEDDNDEDEDDDDDDDEIDESDE